MKKNNLGEDNSDKIVHLESEINHLKSLLLNYENMFNDASDAIFIMHRGKFTDCNVRAESLLDLPKEKIIGNGPADFSPEYQSGNIKSKERLYQLLKEAENGTKQTFQWTYLKPNGKKIITEVSFGKVTIDNKINIQVIVRDITESYNASLKIVEQNDEIAALNEEYISQNDELLSKNEDLLKINTDNKQLLNQILESEQKFKELFNQGADGILVGVGKGEIIDANDSILQLSGYSREELIGKNIGVLFEPEELSDKPLRYDLVKKGDTVIRERRIVKKDGSKVFVEMNTKILSDGRMQAIVRDITRRKKAEIELEKSRELLQKAESVAGLGRFVYHVQSDIWESSPILNKILGIEDHYKKDFGSWSRLIHPDFQADMKEYFITNILKNRELFNKVYKIVRNHDQQERWVLGMAEMECDADNNPLLIFGTIQDINESKNSEIALKESEEKYKNIFYNSPLGIMHYDNNSIITDCNKQFVDILGSTKEKVIGLNMLKDLPNKQMVESIKKSFKDGESYYEDWYTSVTGKKGAFVRVFFKTILNANKEKIAGVCLVEDITERHNSRQLLKENEEKFRRLFERANDSIFLMKDDIFIDCNQKTLQVFGCQREEIIGKPPYLFSPEIQPDGKLSKEKALEKIKTALKGSVDTFEWVHCRLDKTTFDAEVSLNSFKLGEDVFIQAIVRDVTERKKFVERLKASEDKFSKIFDFSPDAIMLSEVRTEKIYDINKGCTLLSGYTKEEAIGKTTIEMGLWADIKDRETYIELLKKGEARNFEFNIRTKYGEIITVLISADIIMINNNPYVLAILRNITDRKETEIKLKISEEKFRNIFNSSSDLIAITKQDGTIINVNQTVLENSGLPIEKIIGQKIYTIISEDFRKKTEERTRLLNERKEIPIIEIEALNKNMEIVPLEVISKLINYENENAILIVARNIKERKDLEKRLINAIIETEEKERQRLAGDLHDEVGPLLSSMKMYINILSSNKEEAKGKYIIEQLNLLIEESIHNIREVSGALNPYLLNRYGLKTATESFFDKSKSLIGVQLVTNIENKRFPINIEATYYRIIKELFNNTIKHAEATNVVIELNYDNDLLNLKYSDNGVGFIFEESTSEKKKGMGVQNIINRVKMINGKYAVSTDKKIGFHFELTTKCPIIENE